jgi:hypothetical protein
MCTAEAFGQLRGALLPFADIGGVQQPASSLLHQVLLKASADKRFIAEEVRPFDVVSDVMALDFIASATATRRPCKLFAACLTGSASDGSDGEELVCRGAANAAAIRCPQEPKGMEANGLI